MHRLVVQEVPNVVRKRESGLVSPRSVLLQRLHHDPIELAAEFGLEPFDFPQLRDVERFSISRVDRADSLTRPRRLGLSDDATELFKTRGLECLAGPRKGTASMFLSSAERNR